MKKLLVIITIFLSQFIFSQIPVTDVAANTSLGMQLAKAIQQVATMKNQLTLLKKGNDYLNKVNNKVTQLNHYQNLISEQSKALKTIQGINKIGKGKVDGNKLNENFKRISATIKTTQMLMTNKSTQMNDFERIELMENELKKAQSVNASLKLQKLKLAF